MLARKIARRTLASIMAAFVASLALAAVAFAAPTVTGADYHATGSTLESGEIDVLTVAGNTGDNVFVTVKQGNRDIAKYIPYALGEGVVKGSGNNWTGVVTLDISSFNTAALDGTYSIEAYASRAGGTPLYTGAIYGVYADLPDGTSKLIGTRTLGSSDAASREFAANDTLYAGGRTYRLANEAGTVAEDSTLHFTYEEYNEATTVDGVIKYVDQAGNVIATDKIAGIAYGEKQEKKIPSAVTADNGDIYRTIYFRDKVVAENPGSTAFTIACAMMTDAEKAAANFYVATIQMVDENGNVIATDTVDVTGVFRYTAPSSIYKTENAAGGDQSVVTYNVVDDPVVVLSAADDGISGLSRTITIKYQSEALETKEVGVTFNLLDGTKRASKKRLLTTKSATVDEANPTAVPEAQIQVDGTTYNIVGAPEDYAYTIGSGKTPVVDVYYTPEGYQASDSYTVTVNYENFLTKQVVSSATYTSDPSTNVIINIETPETFEADGVQYVRLDGQEEPIAHNYYSGIVSYTVYYRDANDTLTSGTVINNIRVVYQDGTTTTTDGGTTTTETVVDGGTTGTDGTAVDGDLQLNESSTYNVFDGDDNNSTLTNESGVDSNTERIEDEETPLASGLEGTGSGEGESVDQAIPEWVLPAGIGALLVVAALIAILFVRRKRNDREEA